MPYRKVGTIEACWYIVKLWALEQLGLNESEEEKAERKRQNNDRRKARKKENNHD